MENRPIFKQARPEAWPGKKKKRRKKRRPSAASSDRPSIDAAAAHRRSGLELFAGVLAAGLVVDRRELVLLDRRRGRSSPVRARALRRRPGRGAWPIVVSSRSSIDAAAAHRRSGLELFAGVLAAGLAVDRRELALLDRRRGRSSPASWPRAWPSIVVSSRSSIDAAAAHRRPGLELFAGVLAAGLVVDRRELALLDRRRGRSSPARARALRRRPGRGPGRRSS